MHASSADSPADPSDVLADCRKRIDRIDAVLVALLRERIAVAVEAGRAKTAIGGPVLVPAREAEVLERVTNLAASPLAPEAIGRIFQTIIDETRTAEFHMPECRHAD